MIQHPAVIALLAGSLLITAMVFYAAWYAFRIVGSWDLSSGSDLQLGLEKKTYLISTLVSYAFAYQLASLFLFIFTADRLSGLLVGAMCAAGSLYANSYGYPAMFLKIVNFLLAGTWLIVNYTDNRAFDYPLIKKKYLFLLLLAPFIAAEMVTQGAYFLSLKPHVITSCCGSLFSPETGKGGGTVASLPDLPVMTAFFASIAAVTASGTIFYFRGRAISGLLFSFLSLVSFAASVTALITFISPYIYELPTHHCPFCILQKEYGYMGYLFYLTLLTGAVSGAGVGALTGARSIASLKTIAPLIQKRLTLVTIIANIIFLLGSAYFLIFSGLKH